MVKGWKKETLEELCIPNGLVRGPFGGALKKEIFVASGYKVYEQRNAIYATTEMGSYYITDEKYRELLRFAIADGDFIVSCSGTIGCIYQLPRKAPKGVINQALLKITIDADKIDAELFQQYFRSDSFQKSIIDDTQGGAMKNLVGMDKFRKALFVIPTEKNEQRAIAAALSDVDGYIAALERLIGKKRDIKKGAMQELLTGKRRLPGFSGEWTEKPLCQIADEIVMGQSPDSRYYNDAQIGLPLVQGNADVENRHTIIRFYTSVTTKYGQKGDIIMTVRAPVGAVAKADFDCCLGRGVCAMRGNDFLYQLLIYFEPQWGAMSTGSTFDSISGNELREVRFTVPEDKDEQTAIAAILSDMDAEIDTLTAKLDKVRNIKLGMMQELLTGRIRLVAEETEVTPVAKPAAKVNKLPKREPQPTPAHSSGHSQQFDDAVMIAGIVDALYSDKYPLGRKKVQKCLYLLRRHQDESTAAFKKKAAGPYADEIRYKGGEPIARNSKYIVTTSTEGKGTTFACGGNISQALGYIQDWGRQADIKWLTEKLKYKKVDELELLATVDMAICDLMEAGTPVSVATIKHLIATNAEWKAKLKKQSFSDANIEWAITELHVLL